MNPAGTGGDSTMTGELDNGRLERLLASPAAFAAVLTLAALLRVWHVLELRQYPSFDHLLLDSAQYDQWARSIAAGDLLGGQRAFYMDPLYPYLLAAVYRLFGHDLLLVRLLQAGLGVATCAICGHIGARVGGRVAGTLAALFMAIYQPAIFNEAEIEKTALGLFLVIASLALLMNRTAPGRFGAGVCLALALLTRGNLMIMIPLGALFILTDPLSGSGPNMESSGRFPGRSLLQALLFVAGCLLVLAPVIGRNYRVSHELVITTSQAGTNFYTGNNPANPYGGFMPVPFVRPYPQYEEQDFRAEAERRSGRQMTPREVSGFWFDETIRHIRDNPGFALTLFLRKLVLTLSDVEMPDGSDMYFWERYSAPLRLPLLTMGWLLPLAAAGVYTSRRNRDARLLAGFVALYGLTLVAFFVFSRYRLHIVPAVAVFAAVGLIRIGQRLRQRDYRALFPVLPVMIVIALLSFSGAATFGITRHVWINSYWDMATLYENGGDYANSLALLLEADRFEPGRTETLCARGRVQLKSGRHGEAVELLSACLKQDANAPDGWYYLGRALEGTADTSAARGCYENQLAVSPGHAPARERLEAIGSRR